MRNLISQNAVCATYACDRAICCSNSISLRENHIIWQSVCHWNILLWVMVCVSLCVLYHKGFGLLCTILPCPNEKNPLDKIFQWARLNCVLRVTPQRKEGHGAIQASFLHLSMRFWKGWGGGKDHLSLWKQRKRQQKQNLNANEIFSHLRQADFHINYFFCICPNTFPLLFGI